SPSPAEWSIYQLNHQNIWHTQMCDQAGEARMTNKNTVLVGCGNMGYAMLQGWLASGKLQSSDVTVIEPADSLRERAGKLGVKAVKNSAEISDTPRLVIIAVKPQVIQDILPDYKPYAASATFLNVAAGTPVAL